MLDRASVIGLLGDFDHTITLDDDWTFAIAYGLNGVGKTKFLELINAVINIDVRKVARSWFASIQLRSDSGLELLVEKHFSAPDEDGKKVSIVYTLKLPSGNTMPWHQEISLGRDDEMARYISSSTSWSQIDENYWQDTTDGEVLGQVELFERYGGARFNRRRSGNSNSNVPEQITDFCAHNPTYLIETQRLGSPQLMTTKRRQSPISQSSPKWSVDAYSTDLKQRLERALADNSLSSQNLDRSFPRRIIEQSLEQADTELHIRYRYGQQDEHRSRLADIGLTNKDTELPLPKQKLDDWQRAVLTTYLDDNAKKLSTFDGLLQKIDILESMINRRFLRKTTDVSVDRGLTVRANKTGDEIPANGLSTGEQHELVLMYNLLFRVQPGTLVLVDEPEISLHVSWQMSFLEDVEQIAKSSEFKFIVATHSPQIIGKWWSRTVELGKGSDS